MLISAAMTSACAHAETGPVADASVPVATAQLSPALDRVVEEGLASQTYPGAVLIVGQPGRILHAKAYGRRSWEADAPAMSLDTIFDMASVSKVAGTATAAWILLDEGAIRLDDPVSKFIPGFEANGKESVTVRDLMTHTSGLKAYENSGSVEKDRREGETTADALMRRYASLKPSYEPRTKYVYSCLNFQTLARIDETASGERLHEFLSRRVWQPLGMKDTGYVLTESQTARIAPTHRLKDGTLSTTRIHDPLAFYHGVGEHCPGNAGLFSTGPDMARFCDMVLSGGEYAGRRILSEGIVAQATSPQGPGTLSEKRGLGWDIYEEAPWTTRLNTAPGDLVVGHTGYTGTLIWLDKHSRTYFVFLANRTLLPAGSDGAEPDMGPWRRRVAETVLRSRPEYASEFAEPKPAQ